MMQTLLSQIGQINLTNLPDQLLTNFAYKLAIFCDKFFPFLYLSLCAKPCLLRIYSFQSLLLSRGLCPINKRESILSFMQACPREYSLFYLHGFSLTISSVLQLPQQNFLLFSQDLHLSQNERTS